MRRYERSTPKKHLHDYLFLLRGEAIPLLRNKAHKFPVLDVRVLDANSIANVVLEEDVRRRRGLGSIGVLGLLLSLPSFTAFIRPT